MLGFQTSVDTTHSWATLVVSALLILALVGCAVLAWRHGLGASIAPLGAAIAIILVSYAVIYQDEGGPTYRQWKWITFFIPLFVASTLAIVVIACFSAVRHPRFWRRVGYGLIGAQMGIAVVLAGGEAFPLGAQADHYLSVTLDQVDLRSNPRLASTEVLNLDTQPYWETMWLAYFLRDKQLTLAPPTYYPTSPPRGRWYIERTGSLTTAGAQVTPLNSTYRLVRVP